MTIKLKPEVKSAWLEALRSGQYTQTTEVLRDETGYCCLGVLCDVYGKQTGTEWSTEEESMRVDVDGITSWTFLKQEMCLPKKVKEWCFETPLEGFSFCNLMELNDSGSSFQEIAEVIETSF